MRLSIDGRNYERIVRAAATVVVMMMFVTVTKRVLWGQCARHSRDSNGGRDGYKVLDH